MPVKCCLIASVYSDIDCLTASCCYYRNQSNFLLMKTWAKRPPISSIKPTANKMFTCTPKKYIAKQTTPSNTKMAPKLFKNVFISFVVFILSIPKSATKVLLFFELCKHNFIFLFATYPQAWILPHLVILALPTLMLPYCMPIVSPSLVD